MLNAVISTAFTLAACSGDDGSDGVQGPAGEIGVQGPAGENGATRESSTDGLQSIIVQSFVAAGNEQCFKGGVRIDSGTDDNSDAVLANEEIDQSSYVCNPSVIDESKNFNRIASFLVCTQIDINCDTDTQTSAEIVAASLDGMTLVYTDSTNNQLGFVDITDPTKPLAKGVIDLVGEPTSVVVKGGYALVAVNTSTNFVDVAGELEIIDIATQTRVRSIDLGGQPDSVAVSPDKNYAAIVIENERDEDLGNGNPPQLPAGNFIIVDTSDTDPANWTTSSVDVTGTEALFGSDPEPEFVDINADNIAVVTRQENNHIILIDLVSGSIVNDFSAGDVDLAMIDITEGALRVDQSESLDNVVREPDGVTWINSQYFATANEGDMDGGSRGFSVFDTAGNVVWDAASTLDHLTARIGHYPDKRSGNKGNEPENAEVGIFGSERFLFVNSERSSVVFVYDIADPKNAVFKQVLPAAVGPEGGLAIPSRNLLVVASEEDERGDAFRSTINVYRYEFADATYPTLVSSDRENGSAIPWGAMSGLSADAMVDGVLYAVEDSFYKSNRIFQINTQQNRASILSREIYIRDANDIFASTTAVGLVDATVDSDNATRINVFDEADLAVLINDDKTVNIDPEGISKAADGGFWLASEGNGTVGDSGRPVNSLNFLFKTDAQGVIEKVITLPSAVNDIQVRFGFESVAK
ncbi:MAG: hypothetical protein ACI9Y1_001099 [Lentisphaeria bacterium]|jgi:hypothetical protein